jgi:hypothetical protein
VWVADSFRGFPAAEGSEDQWETIDYLSVPSDEVRANFERFGLARGVEFVEGFFADTLPGLRDRLWSLIRLDGDTYEATRIALESLYPQLSLGGYLIVDDYGALRECRIAVDEFRSAHGIEEPLERVDWTCVRWRRQHEDFEPRRADRSRPSADRGPVSRPRPAPDRGHVAESSPGPGRGHVAESSPAPADQRDAHIPSFHELALERELESLRTRLQKSEAELARLRTTPLGTLRARVRRELDRRRGL